jgi:hypothetical protein
MRGWAEIASKMAGTFSTLDVACIPHPRVQLLEEDETRCAFINLQ